ncbi:hypothetical protein BKA69DRAFT_853604 [Paraphysoderma sedebokerense]|nr:hypothetical protein BKA69DRAFT_853604 [Paraphysoderma sedebokerense]
MTLSTMSAWRLVNDLKKAKEGNGYIGGTILNLAKGKIDYKLAQLVNKLLLRTHDASLDQVLETALFSNEVINPWKNANLAAIIHDYIQSAVSKQFKGDLHKKISRRADVVASKIINYYQNIMTPFSLDLYSSLQNWRRLMSGILFENSLTSKEEAIGVIERYDKYLRLIGQQSKSQGSSAEIVAPAVDILLAHHAHMMEPLIYQKYCCYNFGKIMDFSRYTSKKELVCYFLFLLSC